MTFACVSEIDVNVAPSYVGKTFLTFDIDWASDEVLGYCIDLVESFGVKATWFATHATSWTIETLSNSIENFIQNIVYFYIDFVPNALEGIFALWQKLYRDKYFGELLCIILLLILSIPMQKKYLFRKHKCYLLV